VERARAKSQEKFSARPQFADGLWSELSFRLRRPLGIVSGAIDKLLITPSDNGKGLNVEVIDFKTNRLRAPRVEGPSAGTTTASTTVPFLSQGAEDRPLWDEVRKKRASSRTRTEQITFDFSAPPPVENRPAGEFSIAEQVRIAASDYELQMQAYVLAVSELMPELRRRDSSITSTLHFLDPNVEIQLDANVLSPDACVRAIDAAMAEIIASGEPEQFPVRTATHCRMCNFLGICTVGREWVRGMRRSGTGQVEAVKAAAWVKG
jgi:hypothetical protein